MKRNKLKMFAYFTKLFGFYNGIKLLIKLYRGNVDQIKLPNIKYPFSLRVGSSDIPTFEQVFIDNDYGMDFPAKAATIIDGGANIGLFSIKMKNQYPDAKIICIEPDPENYEQLKKNLSPYENVFCENYGIWSKDTILKVYDKLKLGKWGMVVEEDLINGKIRATSIDSLLKKHAIEKLDILKLDIETSEKVLFSENFEQWLPKVKMIIIELHDWAEEGCSKPFFEAINKTYNSYQYSVCRENTIIQNNDLQ